MAGWPPPWDEVVRHLERAGLDLLVPTPEKLEEVAGELERAESRLRELLRPAGAPGAGPPGTEPHALRQLRRQVGRVAALLENAGALRLGWARVLGVMIAGYTSRGEPVPLEAPAGIVIEG